MSLSQSAGPTGKQGKQTSLFIAGKVYTGKMNIIYDTRKFKKDLVHSVGHFLTTSSSFLPHFFSFLQLICHDPLH